MKHLVNTESDYSEQTNTIEKLEVKEPSLFKVLLHNDDFTPMDFVVEILISLFNKSQQDAFDIMFKIHNQGVGICGIYVLEIAETKVTQVQKIAKNEGYPLKSSIEKV